MPLSRESILCRYHYNPLDRLVNSTPFEQPTQRYYCKNRLATEIKGSEHISILQHDGHLLAQQRRDQAKVTSTLLATDQQRSVLHALDANSPIAIAYSPYGHRPPHNDSHSLLGFTGERPDPVTGHYHLGNGYRQFNPVLMRFNSPDSWSPFGKGGLNAYLYCEADPVNLSDATGHFATRLLLMIPASIMLVGAGIATAGVITQDRKLTYAGLLTAGAGALIGFAGAVIKGTFQRAVSLSRAGSVSSTGSVSSISSMSSTGSRSGLNGGLPTYAALFPEYPPSYNSLGLNSSRFPSPSSPKITESFEMNNLAGSSSTSANQSRVATAANPGQLTSSRSDVQSNIHTNIRNEPPSYLGTR